MRNRLTAVRHRCGAASKIRAFLSSGGDLAFCGHHANPYAETIRRRASAYRQPRRRSGRGGQRPDPVC
nr:hypothetical protein [Virgisporangium ochraceum]